MISQTPSRRTSQRVEIIPQANSPSSSPITFSVYACKRKRPSARIFPNAAKGLEHLADEPDCLANNRPDDFNRPKGLFYSPRKIVKNIITSRSILRQAARVLSKLLILRFVFADVIFIISFVSFVNSTCTNSFHTSIAATLFGRRRDN